MENVFKARETYEQESKNLLPKHPLSQPECTELKHFLGLWLWQITLCSSVPVSEITMLSFFKGSLWKPQERSHGQPLTQSLTLGRPRPKCLNYLLCNYSSFYRSEMCSLPACSSSYWQDSVPMSCGARASLPGSFLQGTCLTQSAWEGTRMLEHTSTVEIAGLYITAYYFYILFSYTRLHPHTVGRVDM